MSFEQAASKHRDRMPSCTLRTSRLYSLYGSCSIASMAAILRVSGASRRRTRPRPGGFAGDFRGEPRTCGSVCDWFAARGFIAICPDLFWRMEPDLELDPASDRDRAMALLGKLDQTKAVDDAAAAMEFLREHPACTGRVGAVGYCLGGRLAYLLSVRYKPKRRSDITAS